MPPAGLTPSQTIGPFFGVLQPLGGSQLVPGGSPGAIEVKGRVLDGAGEPVPDALIEIWQANAAGRYAHPEDTQEKLLEPGFTGFGRCATGPDGSFLFLTVKPGQVPAGEGRLQAPHINVSILARGLLQRLATRLYFDDEAEANAKDPVLCSIDDPKVRATLVARRDGRAFVFEVRLRGEGETAFFDV
jgi:protocatechuate 3,4-dioxygenase alpha subunit